MSYLIYTPIAILPSIIWLFWYLRKDKHPEPNAMIIRVFIWGALVAFPAIIIENIFSEIIGVIDENLLSPMFRTFIFYFIGVALTEELLKFLAVHFRVLRKTTLLDEPVDAMIYMIISALGFAAIENVFLLTPLFDQDFLSTLTITFSRFIGATFLHVLASAIIGYYLALSLYNPKKRFRLLIHGFALAILLHGFYNILVIGMEENFFFIFPVAFIIIFSAALISVFFKRLSKMKSISTIT